MLKNVHCLDSQKSHDELDMLARNRLSNVSFFVCSAGELVILAVLAGILIGIPGLSVSSAPIVLEYGVSLEAQKHPSDCYLPDVCKTVLVGIPWFFIEQHRPGAQLPPGTSYITIP
jgi:hypothetical protein